MVEDGRKKTRRRFLATSAVVGVATSLAGCSEQLTGQIGNDAESGDGSSTDTPASSTDTAASSTDTPASTEDDSGFGYGSTEAFTLEEGDGLDPAYDDLAKPVRFEASAGDEVTITQTSEAFNAYLVLQGPSGAVVAEDDDGDGIGSDSRISTTLTESGEYTIWAGSFSRGETGPFTLSLERGLVVPESEVADPGLIAYGETREFILDESDGRDPAYNDLAKAVWFQGSSGDEATITMTAEFDTYLVLEGPDGTVAAENDDADGIGRNSRISTTLSLSGEYTIWAGSYYGSETGPFTLSLERGLTDTGDSTT